MRNVNIPYVRKHRCVGDATKSCTACDGDWRGADCNTRT
jgi:hypothetical protein